MSNNPGREVYAAYITVRRNSATGQEYLMRYNMHWKSYNFISGRWEKKDGYLNGKIPNLLETAYREAGEEIDRRLKVKGKKDYILKNLITEKLVINAYSERYKKETEYHLGIYLFEYLKPWLEFFKAINMFTPQFRWLKEEDIERDKAPAGEKISGIDRKIIAYVRKVKDG